MAWLIHAAQNLERGHVRVPEQRKKEIHSPSIEGLGKNLCRMNTTRPGSFGPEFWREGVSARTAKKRLQTQNAFFEKSSWIPKNFT